MKKVLIFILFLSFFSLFGCTKSKGFTKTIFVFDTTVTINLYEGDEANVDDIVDILNYYHKLTDAYHTYEGMTNVKSINDGIKQGTTSFDLDQELAYMLMFPAYQSILNPAPRDLIYYDAIMLALGELTNLWKQAIAAKSLPEDAVLNQIATNLDEGLYNYTIEDNSVLKVEEGSKVEFDLGSITKGFASAKINNYLSSKHISKFMIDLGQSTILLGEKSNGKGFNVGVNGTNYVLKDQKKCYIGTASILEQKAEIDGKIYHHIIDPKTLFPTNTYETVVVIMPWANFDFSDMLATYLMICPEKAQNVCNYYQGAKVYFFNNGVLVNEVKSTWRHI